MTYILINKNRNENATWYFLTGDPIESPKYNDTHTHTHLYKCVYVYVWGVRAFVDKLTISQLVSFKEKLIFF